MADRYTQVGFKKTRVPKGLWGDIRDYYKVTEKYEASPWKYGKSFIYLSINITPLFIAERCDAGLHNCETIEYSENECHVKNVTTVMLMELEESMRVNIQKVPEYSLLKDTELICANAL